MSFDTTVELPLRPSVGLLLLTSLLHGLVLTMLVLTLPPGAPLWLLLVATAASWFWLRRHPALGFGPRALTRLTWHVDGHWQLVDGVGKSHEAALLPHSSLWPGLAVLRFRLNTGGSRTRLIASADAPEEALRRLRARLRLNCATS